MGFGMDEKSPLTEKILGLILKDELIPVDEFHRRICNLRIRSKECKQIENYLISAGYIRRSKKEGDLGIINAYIQRK